jgi:hypothetical protein
LLRFRDLAKGISAAVLKLMSCFDHVIALDEPHVRRLAREYIAYYNADRTYNGLGKDTPSGRAVEKKPAAAELVALPRLGGHASSLDLEACGVERGRHASGVPYAGGRRAFRNVSKCSS